MKILLIKGIAYRANDSVHLQITQEKIRLWGESKDFESEMNAFLTQKIPEMELLGEIAFKFGN